MRMRHTAPMKPVLMTDAIGFWRAHDAIRGWLARQERPLLLVAPAMSGAVLYVTKDVDLRLHLQPARRESKVAASETLRSFEVVGPDLAVGCVTREAAMSSRPTTGFLSPMAVVSLPDRAKASAGIPIKASHFAYLYPLECMAGQSDRLLKDVALLNEPWLDPLLFGGFVYFDAAGKVLRINALGMTPTEKSKNQLFLEGPYDASSVAFGHLAKMERIKPVTLESLREAELRAVGWVNPGELVGGHALSAPKEVLNERTNQMELAKSADWEHGAFVYECGEIGDDPNRSEVTYMFFRIALDAGTKSGPGSFMAEVLQSTRDVAEEAEDQHRQLQEELADHRRPPAQRWLKQNGFRLFGYYIFGCWMYGKIEEWHWFDTVYFLTTTATTVGYGDITPSSTDGRAFTSIYLPLGCVYVMSAMTPIVGAVLAMISSSTVPLAICIQRVFAGVHACARSILDCFWACLRCCCCLCLCSKPRRRRKAKADVYIPPAVDESGNPVMNTQAQYLNILMGPLLLVVLTALVAFFGFGDDVVSSIYFSIVTMTTVGYGDMYPEDWPSKLALIFLMPVATAALANAITEAGKIATRDSIRNAKFQLIIEDLLLQEAGGDPNKGLNKADFITATLKAYDLVDAETLEVIKEGFGKLMAVDGKPKPFASEEKKTGRAAASKVEDDEELDSRTVFEHLSRQRRVRHRPPGSTSQSLEASGIIEVDMSSPDKGFGEWYAKHWVPAVYLRAGKALPANGVGYQPLPAEPPRKELPKAARLPPPSPAAAQKAPSSHEILARMRKAKGTPPIPYQDTTPAIAASAYQPVAAGALRKGNPFVYKPETDDPEYKDYKKKAPDADPDVSA